MSIRRPPRWFQLSLRSLFLLTLVVAVALAGYRRVTRYTEAQRRADSFGYDAGQSQEPFDRWPDFGNLPNPGDPFAQPPSGQRDDPPSVDRPPPTRPAGDGDSLRAASDAGARVVHRSLKWLAEHQLPDGSWSYDHRMAPKCGGRCTHPGTLKDERFGATGLALLAFLGAGQTHKAGEYKRNVDQGIAWLVRNMDAKTGQMFRGEAGMEAQGVATLALCEACANTNDKSLLGPARAAIGFILPAQDPKGGGWGSAPRQPGQATASGWQVLALKSAHRGQIANVPPQAIAGMTNFLNSVQADSGARYRNAIPDANTAVPGAEDRASTAIGIICRLHLGWKKENGALARGVAFLEQTGAVERGTKDDLLYNYYAAQALHHWQGAETRRFNAALREALASAQAMEGHETGSWFTGGGRGIDEGGRHCVTCLNCLALEVYYRWLSVYQPKAVEDGFGD